MIVKLYEKLKELIRGGLFHILGSSMLSRVMALISSVLVIRYLPKTDYGYYTIANNLYSYLAVFIGMGMSSAILLFCSEQITEREKNGIYRFTLKRGTACNFAVMLGILLLAAWKKQIGDTQTAYYLAMMCGLPYASFLHECVAIIFRVRNRNIAYSRFNMLYSVTVVIGNILFSRLWHVTGLIVSNYVAVVIVLIYGCAMLLQEKEFISGLKEYDLVAPKKKREITRYSVLCAITNFTSTMLVLLDVTCLDIVLSDPTVLADYKVAAAVPSACVLIPSALLTYFYPQIVRMYSSQPKEFYGFLKKIFLCFLGVNLCVGIGLCLFAPLIIYLIYGQKYMNIIPLFRILTLNFFIYGSVKMLFGNVIAAMKKSEINLVIAVISGVFNVGMNMWLIPRMGSNGAAIATLCVSLIAGIISLGYVAYTRKGNIN